MLTSSLAGLAIWPAFDLRQLPMPRTLKVLDDTCWVVDTKPFPSDPLLVAP